MTSGNTTILVLVFSVIVLGHQVELMRPVGNKEHTTTGKQRDDQVENHTGVNPKQKKRILEAFESTLLNVFGLRTRPRPNRKVHIPKYIMDLYSNYKLRNMGFSDDEDEMHNEMVIPYGNTIRSFYQQDDEIIDSLYRTGEAVLRFNVTSLPSDETLKAAEIRIYREGINSSNNQNSSDSHDSSDSQESSDDSKQRLKIVVLEIIRPASPKRDAITRILDTRVVNARTSRWETFDISPAVQKWKSGSHLNHGVEVHLTTLTGTPSKSSHVRLKRSARMHEKRWASQQPFLVTYSDDEKSSPKRTRSRRNSKSRQKRRKNKQKRKKMCRRHKLYVDFSDVGWDDWIVAPPGYEAFFCTGDCPYYLADNLNSTNHAIVQTLVHSVDQNAVPRPCCVPTELSPISMLYLDENEKVVLKNYQDMVVESCGCR